MGGGPGPLLLWICSVLLHDGPRLDLTAAKYGVEDGAAKVDPGSDPEHLPPARHGVLQTTEEESASVPVYLTVIPHILLLLMPLLTRPTWKH